MKKTIVALVILLSVYSFSSAQMKNEDKWGCSIAINSIQAQMEVPLLTSGGVLLVDADGNIISGGNRIDKSFSFSIIPKYKLSNEVLLRFEFGLTSLNLQANSNEVSQSYHQIGYTNVSTKLYRYTAGFQWTFIKTNRLESYCGISVSYNNYSLINDNFYYEHRNMPNDTLQYWVSGKEIIPGGFSIGVGALAGFNIYLNKWISVGAELSSFSLYYKFGGNATLEGMEQSLPSPTNVNLSTYTSAYRGFKISKIISSFNVSFWF